MEKPVESIAQHGGPSGEHGKDPMWYWKKRAAEIKLYRESKKPFLPPPSLSPRPPPPPTLIFLDHEADDTSMDLPREKITPLQISMLRKPSAPNPPPLGVFRREYVRVFFDVCVKCDSCGFCMHRNLHLPAIKDSRPGKKFDYFFECFFCHAEMTMVRDWDGGKRSTVSGGTLCKHGVLVHFPIPCGLTPPVLNDHELEVNGPYKCKHELKFLEDEVREFWDSNKRGRILYSFTCLRCHGTITLSQDAVNLRTVQGATQSSHQLGIPVNDKHVDEGEEWPKTNQASKFYAEDRSTHCPRCGGDPSSHGTEGLRRLQDQCRLLKHQCLNLLARCQMGGVL